MIYETCKCWQCPYVVLFPDKFHNIGRIVGQNANFRTSNSFLEISISAYNWIRNCKDDINGIFSYLPADLSDRRIVLKPFKSILAKVVQVTLFIVW